MSFNLTNLCNLAIRQQDGREEDGADNAAASG